jgi:hypothetical protein
MAISISNIQTLFQTFYPERDLQYLIPQNLPLLNAISKSDDLSGDVVDHPFLYGTPQGYSLDFNTAQTQAGLAPRAVRGSFRVSQAYKIMEFLDKDILLSHGPAAYADIFQKSVEGAYQSFYQNMDVDLHGAATGWRGTVTAIAGQTNPVNGATLLTNQVAFSSIMPGEAVFEQDQLLQLATYAGFPVSGSIFPPSDGRAPTNISSSVQVVAVDPLNQTLTLSDGSVATVGAFLTQAGGAAGFSTTNLSGGLIGLDAWQPYGGPAATGDNFAGINRATYGTKLAGYWVDGSRFSTEDAIKRLASRMALGGAQNSNLCLINPLDLDAMDSKLSTLGRYSTFDTAMYGFESIVIRGATGRIDCVADPHMYRGYARLIDPSTWLLRHKLALPHVVDVEGRTVEQGLNFDGRSLRLRAYMQLFCTAPHKNGIVKLPTVI